MNERFKIIGEMHKKGWTVMKETHDINGWVEITFGKHIKVRQPKKRKR